MRAPETNQSIPRWPIGGVVAAAAFAALLAAPGLAPIALAGDAAVLSLREYSDEAFREAVDSRAPVVLYFEADWCAPCKEMHDRTFRDPAVLEAAEGTRFLRIDMSGGDPVANEAQRAFRVFGAPTTIFYSAGGKERERRIGFIPPALFVRLLRASGEAGTTA